MAVLLSTHRWVPVTVKKKVGDLGFYHGVHLNRSDKVVADSSLMDTIQQAALKVTACRLYYRQRSCQTNNRQWPIHVQRLERHTHASKGVIGYDADCAHQVIVRSRLYANGTDQQDLYTLYV